MEKEQLKGIGEKAILKLKTALELEADNAENVPSPYIGYRNTGI